MKCKNCGSENIGMSRDSRGLPEARCLDCGAFQKKLSATELADLIEEKQAKKIEKAEDTVTPEVERPVCRYCTERWVMEVGGMHSGVSYVPHDIKYCPMCGRKLTGKELNY